MRLTKIIYNVKEGSTAVFLLLDCLQNCHYRQSLSDFELESIEHGAETMWARLLSWCQNFGGSDCMLAYMQSSPPSPTTLSVSAVLTVFSRGLSSTKITLKFIIKQDKALHKAFCLYPTLAIISRDVSKSQTKEGFVEVGRTKRLVRCLEIIEGIILPIILLIFTLIYWTYAFVLYTSAEE